MARRRWTGPAAVRLAAALALPAALGAEPAPLFRDATAESGLAVAHDDGDRGRLELRAIMGPGAALLDYDLDGDLDLYLVTGGPLAGDPAPAGTVRGRLLRNDLTGGAGGAPAPRWVDVTAGAGSRRAVTASAPPRATSTGTALPTSSSPTSTATGSGATAATAASRQPPTRCRTVGAGASPAASSTSRETATWTSTWCATSRRRRA